MRAPVKPLSPQRAQVLHLLAHGYSRKMIANLLGLSPHTVKDHTRAVCEHFGVHGCRPEMAVSIAREMGVLPKVNPLLWRNESIAHDRSNMGAHQQKETIMRTLSKTELNEVTGGMDSSLLRGGSMRGLDGVIYDRTFDSGIRVDIDADRNGSFEASGWLGSDGVLTSDSGQTYGSYEWADGSGFYQSYSDGSFLYHNADGGFSGGFGDNVLGGGGAPFSEGMSLTVANWLDRQAEKILTEGEDLDNDGDRDLTDLAQVFENIGDDLRHRVEHNPEANKALEMLLSLEADFGASNINTLANIVDAVQGDRNGR